MRVATYRGTTVQGYTPYQLTLHIPLNKLYVWTPLKNKDQINIYIAL